MQKLAYCLNIQHAFTPVYHPEANPVERKNRDLKTQLAILVDGDHRAWAERLPSIRYAMNTSNCLSTGHTPAYLTFGRELRTYDDVKHDLRQIILSENFVPEITPKLTLLADTLKRAKEVQENKEEKRKKWTDDRRRPAPAFQPGDLVLVAAHVLSNAARYHTAKLAPRRDGPYVILRRHGPCSYEVAHPADPKTPLGSYHSSALSLYQGSASNPPNPERPLRRRGRPRKQQTATEATPGLLAGTTLGPEGETVTRRPKQRAIAPPAQLNQHIESPPPCPRRPRRGLDRL
ncbi:hypothetical protein HF086_005488 [Spodoptera exigua]|uniref:Tf2-1-like SH3-like domain-containing protein n=1 Tax=Spodoptera exigua TaxID=7107 RepID=A0A922MK33_SPOEX|nr:hypothetical protein HF086_005488 [Spodoptera exigua]